MVSGFLGCGTSFAAAFRTPRSGEKAVPDAVVQGAGLISRVWQPRVPGEGVGFYFKISIY